MNFQKHQTIFASIALVGFVLLWFTPQLGSALFLGGLGALLGARQAGLRGPRQPRPALWITFFVLVAIGMVIRSMFPEENFGGFAEAPASLIAYWGYQIVVNLAFALFGYLAYSQRVGRATS